MSELPYNRLVEVAHDRAEDNFRGAGRYTPADTDVLYHRDDLDEETLRERVEQAAERARDRLPLVEDDLGGWRAGFELHEDAFLVHLRAADGEGAVVSLEPTEAGHLADLVKECHLALTEPEPTTEPPREL